MPEPTDIFKLLFGSKQLGAAAQPFQAGVSGFQPSGLLNPDQGNPNDFLQNLIGQQTQPTTIEELLAQQPQNAPPQIPQAQANDQPVTSKPSVFNTDEQNAGLEPPGFGERVGGFFGNVDQNLQSPSKVLGLGLLSQIDPRLAQGGLLASGLFGKNRVF